MRASSTLWSRGTKTTIFSNQTPTVYGKGRAGGGRYGRTYPGTVNISYSQLTSHWFQSQIHSRRFPPVNGGPLPQPELMAWKFTLLGRKDCSRDTAIPSRCN